MYFSHDEGVGWALFLPTTYPDMVVPPLLVTVDSPLRPRLQYFGRYTAAAGRRAMSETASVARATSSGASAGTSQVTNSKTMEAGAKIRASGANQTATKLFM